MEITLRRLRQEDSALMEKAFAAIGWNKPAAQYDRYFAEQEADERIVLVAFHDETFCGYGCVVWKPNYPPFREQAIPEIQDLNVLPKFQRNGIATRIIAEAEKIVGERSSIVGIGFGLTTDYGAAQRLYVRLGYVPDGRGLAYDDRFITPGETVRADDSLVLHLTKDLHS